MLPQELLRSATSDKGAGLRRVESERVADPFVSGSHTCQMGMT